MDLTLKNITLFMVAFAIVVALGYGAASNFVPYGLEAIGNN
ncbi:hypothetical protein [Vibrio alginolyticus]